MVTGDNVRRDEGVSRHEEESLDDNLRHDDGLTREDDVRRRHEEGVNALRGQ